MRQSVLVVENDSGTRRLLDVFLRRESFEVDAVATGNEALLLFEHVDYAAVVLDLMIPGRTGTDVLDELAERRPGLLERVVVVSSATESHLRDVRGRYPAVAVLQKPFDLTELLVHVQQRAERQGFPRETDAAQTFVRRSVVAGAKAGVVARSRGEVLELVTSVGYPPGVAESYFPLALDEHYPLCVAARHGRAVWVSTLHGEEAAKYPLLVPVWRKFGSFALAAVPIFGGDRVAGAVGWSFAEPQVFGDQERANLTSVAAVAAELLGGASTSAGAGRA